MGVECSLATNGVRQFFDVIEDKFDITKPYYRSLIESNNYYQTKEQAEQVKAHLDKTTKLISLVLSIQGELGGEWFILKKYNAWSKSTGTFYYPEVIYMKKETAEQICELLNSGRVEL